SKTWEASIINPHLEVVGEHAPKLGGCTIHVLLLNVSFATPSLYLEITMFDHQHIHSVTSSCVNDMSHVCFWDAEIHIESEDEHVTLGASLYMIDTGKSVRDDNELILHMIKKYLIVT
ncbi:hypothetical protein ACJX0J_025353, partial [Zea mays]